MDYFDFLSPLVMLIEDSWLLQGLFINTAYTILSIPITNKIVTKIFKNRKKIKIANAQQELYTEYVKRIFSEDNITEKNLKNLLYVISSKYDLLIGEVYGNDELFLKNITNTILNLNIIDEKRKERLVASIRKKILIDDHILNTTEYSFNNNESEESMKNFNEYIDSYEENIWEINTEEKRIIKKFTFIASILIFLLSLSSYHSPFLSMYVG